MNVSANKRAASPGLSGDPLLKVTGLTKRYSGVVAVDQLDLELRNGEICGVIGPNGAGKSTLVGLLGGALKASAGRISFEGRDITGLPAPERARLGIGRTYQIPRPFLDMSVEENLQVAQFSLAALAPAGLVRSECRDLLERTGLADVARLRARALPLLRRKRLEVARALALKPKLLLLDEVGAGLIESELTDLIALIRSLASGERAIIVIEHVIRVVKECCARLVVLNFGRKLAAGPTAEVLASDDVAAVYLGTAHAAAASVSAAVSTGLKPPAFANGEDAARSALAKPPTARAQPLLELSGISAGYGLARVLSGIDFAVSRGEAVAVLGTNGAGKTTLANVITGAIKPTAGRVCLGGDDVTGLPAHLIAARGIAHCMEGRRIFDTLSIEENLLIAARAATVAERKRRLDEIFNLFPVLGERRNVPGTSISGGQQQMLAIGRALMAKPLLVIFDEISLGLAPVIIDRIYEALARLRDSGLTMIVIEQDVDRALAVASEAYVLERGAFALAGRSAAIRTDERLRHLYIGEA
jgi:branched-chain amino acid transport system ATP-binding protein